MNLNVRICLCYEGGLRDMVDVEFTVEVDIRPMLLNMQELCHSPFPVVRNCCFHFDLIPQSCNPSSMCELPLSLSSAGFCPYRQCKLVHSPHMNFTYHALRLVFWQLVLTWTRTVWVYVMVWGLPWQTYSMFSLRPHAYIHRVRVISFVHRHQLKIVVGRLITSL